MSATTILRRILRRAGIAIGRYANTIDGRRQQILDHYGIGLLIDVGANVGQYASRVREAGYRGRLLSLEPLSDAYRELEKAAASDGDWQTRQVAVGASSGTLTLHRSRSSIFSSALELRAETVSVAPNARYVGSEEVVLARLDDLVSGDGPERIAVKIDVQGYERDVLDGAQRLLTNVQVLEIELSPEPVYEGQMLMDEALDRLRAAGLVLSLVENLLREPQSGRALQFNGIFVRAR